MKCLSIFGLVYFWVIFSVAQSATPTPATSPTPITMKAPKIVQVGKSVEFEFEDGRAISIHQAIGKKIRSNLGMKQIENTCQPDQQMAVCQIRLDIANYGQYGRWSKNPDPAKIGQVVEYVFNSQGQEIPAQKFQNEGSLYFWFMTLTNTEFAGQFQADEIVCDNLQWLDIIPHQNDVYHVASWTGEQMGFTPEVQATENQTSSGAFKVELQKVDDKTVRFLRTGLYRSAGLPPYLSTQTLSLMVPKAGGLCQLTFEIDLQNIAKDVTDPEFQKIDPSTQTTISNYTSFLDFGLGQALGYLFMPGAIKELR